MLIKSIMMYSALIIVFFFTTLGYGGIRKSFYVQQQYKLALDAGVDAAVKHATYISNDDLQGMAYGFGTGYEDKNNISVDKNDSLFWFYNVFYRNVGIEDNQGLQQYLKQFITMKCLVEYDRLSIADAQDNWVVEKPYIISYNGHEYLFTLSDQVFDMQSNIWLKDTDIGLNPQTRQFLVLKFIKDEVEAYVNTVGITRKDKYFTVDMALNDADASVNSITGSNMIVFADSMPIPSMNVFNPTQKLYSFAFGGSEVVRE